MGKLRILSKSGDDIVTWDQRKASVGDPAAIAAVREAERIVKEHQTLGGAAYTITPEGPQVLKRFDPEANEIVLVPRVVGG
jgi:hypothetical protein